MKKLLSIFIALPVLFIACKDKSADTTQTLTPLNNSSILTDKTKHDTVYVVKKDAVPRRSMPVQSNGTIPSGNSGANSTAPVAANGNQDKGWSKAASSTAIGVGAGAAAGAIIASNKVEGALIGAAVGGGASYIIGRSKDKKSGRVARKKAARKAAAASN